MKKILIISFFVLSISQMGFAQAPPPPPPTPPVGTGAPLDNEVAFLLLATTLFGVWKLQKVKTAEKF